VSYYYDNLTNAKGKLVKVSSSVSTTEYTGFDILGRVTSHKQTTDGTDYTTAYTYKLNGALDEETYPSTRVVKNQLDANGDLSAVESKKTSSAGLWRYADTFTYNATGAVTSMQLGNGLWEKTVFNSRLQPTQIGLGTTTGTTGLLQLDYSYGTTQNNGNVQSQTITVPGITHPFVQNYVYDPLNRLQSATETSNSSQTWKQEFSYDRFGNRNFVTGTGHTDTLGSCTTMCNPSFDTSNNRINSTGYSFDSSGNTLTDPSGQNFTYDAENKQVLVTNSNGTVGQYWYEGDGKRVKKYVPGTGETTVFVYDAAGKEIAEYSSIVPNSADAKVNYVTTDDLGTPRINTNANGTVTGRHDYMPFGEEIDSSLGRTNVAGYDNDTIRKQFTGYERDNETDLDFAGVRFYSARLGRFLGADWFAPDIYTPQTLNRFQYCLNNPLRFIDSDGNYEEDVHRDLTAALAYAVGFSEEQSDIIGRADQWIDDNPKTNPERLLNFAARRDYHFTSPERRDQLWETYYNNVAFGNNAGAYSALGTFLHAEQDSYSHEGFGWFWGQAPSGNRRGFLVTSWNVFWEEVRKVDKTNFDPGKAERMAADTFSRLLRARNMMENTKRYGAFRKPIDYSLIKDDVARWVRADDKAKPIILKEIRTKVDQWFAAQDAPIGGSSKRKKRSKTSVRLLN
jgi:RHS repeat-associated protein